jgi:hypothetical protein
MLRFIADLVVRAWHSLVASMGTTTLAVAVAFIVIPILLLLVEWSREGWETMRAHWQGNLLVAAVTAVVWLAIFCYHLLYGVPQEIRQEADAVRPPNLAEPILPRGWELKSPSLRGNASRRLTSKQKAGIVAALSVYKGQKYALDWTRNNQEVMRYAQDFDEAFNRAGWGKVTYGPLWAPIGFPESFRFPNQFGVQWYITDRAPENPACLRLRTVLHDCCNIVADGVRWPDPRQGMDADVIYVYVGPKWQAGN